MFQTNITIGMMELELDRAEKGECAGELLLNNKGSGGCGSVAEEADAIFKAIVYESVYDEGDHGIPHKYIQIPATELDLAKLREGRAFFRRHLTSCIMAIGIFVVYLYPIQRMSSVLFRLIHYRDAEDASPQRA